ncbi:MAG: hypothetical protein J6R83_00720 [Clostridia bacterium]|nr:hypothetical protein [Clostridia bacterium]
MMDFYIRLFILEDELEILKKALESYKPDSRAEYVTNDLLRLINHQIEEQKNKQK